MVLRKGWWQRCHSDNYDDNDGDGDDQDLIGVWRQSELRPYSGVELVLGHHGGGKREREVAVELRDWEVGGEGGLSEE